MEKNRTNKDGTPDRRCTAGNKPYCGTKAPKGSETAAFKMKARDGFATDGDYERFLTFFLYKAARFKEELSSNEQIAQWAVQHCEELMRGNFYTALADNFGKPYLEHTTKCNNAWYFHNDAALLQRVAKNIRIKTKLAEICERHGWNSSHVRKINEEAHEELGRWFSWEYIRNICKSRSYPEFPTDMRYELDYGTQSKYTIISSDWVEDGRPEHVEMTLLIGNSEERTPLVFSYDIPERLLLQPYTLIAMRKPCFHMGEDGELWATVPYWYYPAELELGGGALGADAGIIRIMKCGMVFKDGRYLENIALSAEVEKRNAHIRILMENKERLYRKMERIERLVKHNRDTDAVKGLKSKLSRIEGEYKGVRSNIAAERESLCWLVARDLGVLVRQYGGDRVRIEDLRWIGGSGQSWNFSQMRKSIEIVLKRYGIKLEAVNACDSSRSDPSCEGELLASGPTVDSRTCEWNDGSIHDRDDTSGLELACREPGRKTHDRDAKESVEVEGVAREYAPEIVAVKARGRKAKKLRRSRRASGRSAGIDRSYRPDIEEMHSSIRKRREELSKARERGGEGFSWKEFVEGASRSVATLRECRSVGFVPSGAFPGGVPARPSEVIRSSIDEIANCIVLML